jgi:hypothetical protein
MLRQNQKFITENLTKGLHKDIGFSTLKYTYFNWVNEEF